MRRQLAPSRQVPARISASNRVNFGLAMATIPKSFFKCLSKGTGGQRAQVKIWTTSTLSGQHGRNRRTWIGFRSLRRRILSRMRRGPSTHLSYITNWSKTNSLRIRRVCSSTCALTMKALEKIPSRCCHLPSTPGKELEIQSLLSFQLTIRSWRKK